VSGKKKFFTDHTKSSAAVVSLGIHAVFILVALSFVAVTVIKKDDQRFEAKSVIRPRTQLKKLQVPVKIKRPKRPPKLRQRIVVKPMVNRNIPEIKMPEISGIKSGLGSAGSSGLGGAGSLGFSMPEFELFGIKSRGEKVYLILDSSAEMMYDELGGIQAYAIIKNKLVQIVEKLGSTTIFNVCVFDKSGQTFFLFPSMAPATEENAAKVKAWLDPLNAIKTGMGARDYGSKTLGPGGVKVEDDLRIGQFLNSTRDPGWWHKPAMLSMSQKADTIFLLTNRWPGMGYSPNLDKDVGREEWEQSPAGKKWEECYRKGLKMLDEENKKRAARGDPPKVLRREAWAINQAYFPNVKGPPRPEWVSYTPEDFHKAFLELRAGSKSSGMTAMPVKSGVSRRKKNGQYSFNVIHFVKKGEKEDAWSTAQFEELTKRCNGEYQTIAGLEAILRHAEPPEQ